MDIQFVGGPLCGDGTYVNRDAPPKTLTFGADKYWLYRSKSGELIYAHESLTLWMFV